MGAFSNSQSNSILSDSCTVADRGNVLKTGLLRASLGTVEQTKLINNTYNSCIQIIFKNKTSIKIYIIYSFLTSRCIFSFSEMFWIFLYEYVCLKHVLKETNHLEGNEL